MLAPMDERAPEHTPEHAPEHALEQGVLPLGQEPENGRLRLSYSSISTYEICPLQWRFRYVDRLPTRRTPALAFGEALHEALRRFYHQPVPVAPPLGALWEYLDEAWDGAPYAHAEEERLYKEHAREVLANFHRANAPRFRIPVALEQRFEVSFDGVALTGQIDRMDRHPDGTYEIIDYKSSRRLPPRRVIERDLQLSIYAMAAQDLWGITAGRLTLYFLLPGQAISYSRTPQQLDADRGRIAAAAASIRAGAFEPRENPLCNWCDFQDRCPLWAHRARRAEGTAPPDIDSVVAEWIEHKRRLRQDAQRLEELSEAIHAYCEAEGLMRLFGEDAAVTRVERTLGVYDPAKVRSVLEPLGLLDRVARVDDAAVDALLDGLPPGARSTLEAARSEETSFALYLRERRRRRG